jgi:hypothetical protein
MIKEIYLIVPQDKYESIIQSNPIYKLILRDSKPGSISCLSYLQCEVAKQAIHEYINWLAIELPYQIAKNKLK